MNIEDNFEALNRSIKPLQLPELNPEDLEFDNPLEELQKRVLNLEAFCQALLNSFPLEEHEAILKDAALVLSESSLKNADDQTGAH